MLRIQVDTKNALNWLVAISTTTSNCPYFASHMKWSFVFHYEGACIWIFDTLILYFQPVSLKVAFKIMTKNSKIRVQEVDLESVHSQENADMIINACHSTIIIECKS